MENQYYRPNQFAKLINVSVKTLQRWDREDVLTAFRTPTNMRYYTHEQYIKLKGIQNTVTINCESEEQKQLLVAYAKSIGCKDMSF